jgi:hypothetical protein
MALFDDVPRTDLDAASHGEPLWTYINRSARPEIAHARTLIEGWFQRLCSVKQISVLELVRSTDNQKFVAGLWELCLHELFTRLGYTVKCEPTVGQGRNIDFLVQREASAFYLEATIARKSDAERGADARRERIYRELDKIKSISFLIGITIDSAGPNDMRNLAGLRAQLEQWLSSLDPAAAERQWQVDGEGPTYSWGDGAGWSLVFEAVPTKPELWGKPVERPLGLFIDETGGLVNDERPLRRALNGKRPSRYGDLSLPYVVAVDEEPFALGDEEWHRMNVLFGHDAVQYGGGQTRSVRMPDGFWRGPGARPQNRRVSA